MNRYGETEEEDMRKYRIHLLVMAALALLMAGCMADPAEPVAPTETETTVEATTVTVTE